MTLNPALCNNCGGCHHCDPEWAALREDRINGRSQSYAQRIAGLARRTLQAMNVTPERRATVLRALGGDTVPSPDSTAQLAARLRQSTPQQDKVRAELTRQKPVAPREAPPKGLPAPPAPSVGDLGERIRSRNQK
jgi:hypothetical protein